MTFIKIPQIPYQVTTTTSNTLNPNWIYNPTTTSGITIQKLPTPYVPPAYTYAWTPATSPTIDRIILAEDKEFIIGDIVKSIDNKIGMIMELILRKNKEDNSFAYYFKVVLNHEKLETWVQFRMP